MQRLQHLDGLRGVAALLVVYQHLVEYAGRMAPSGGWVSAHLAHLLGYMDLGKAGVIAFFALSGFVVPLSFRQPALPRLSFALSRVFRLYPAYWVSLALAALLLPALGLGGVSAAQLAANATMVQLLLGQADVVSVYWTLLIELGFYASCVLVYSLGGLQSPRWCVGMACALLALALGGSLLRGQVSPLVPVGAPLYLALMWYCAAVRLWLLERVPGARRCCLLALPLLLALFPLAWSMAYDDHTHRESVLAVVTGFYAGLALFFWCVLRRAFDAPLLVRAGALSYGLYLFHPLALDVAHTLARGLAWPQRLAALALVTVLLSFAAAWLVRRGVELPGIALGKRLARRLAALHAAQRGARCAPGGANTQGQPR